MTESAEVPTTDPIVGLLGKLQAVAQAITHVEKRGENEHHHYSYVMAVDVVRDVRKVLLDQNVMVLPQVDHATHEGGHGNSGKGILTTVAVTYRFMDTETGAKVEVPWIAAGMDTGGDKGIYKAYTGALKYMFLSTFLLPMSDDPENDALTQRDQAPAAQGHDSVAVDADRPAATAIPLDRAKSIAGAAIAAELAAWSEGEGSQTLVLSPVLKAKLADLGVDKLGQLDVDQAEALEAFIAAEVEDATTPAQDDQGAGQ